MHGSIHGKSNAAVRPCFVIPSRKEEESMLEQSDVTKRLTAILSSLKKTLYALQRAYRGMACAASKIIWIDDSYMVDD